MKKARRDALRTKIGDDIVGFLKRKHEVVAKLEGGLLRLHAFNRLRGPLQCIVKEHELISMAALELSELADDLLTRFRPNGR